jgi:hypothetical protein
MSKLKFFGVAAIFVLCAATAMATNFRAADQVYVPAVIHAVGGSGTFLSDVFISNLSKTDSVSISVIYCSGAAGCPGTTSTTFPNLITLQPLERRELVDFVGLPTSQGGLGMTSGFGQVVFNGCKAGTSCGPDTQDANGVSPNFRNISVETRVYSIPPGTTLASNPPTNGQLFSGFPWYNFVSSDQAANGLDQVFITGIRQNGAVGQPGTYLSNIVLVNESQFSNTVLKVTLYAGNAPTTPVGTPYQLGLGPLGQAQVSFPTAFPNVTGTNYFVTVSQISSAATSDAPAACLPNGCPAFFAYGSILDNVSGDATTLEPQYFNALTDAQINCLYPAAGTTPCKGTPAMHRAVKH